jgi:Ca2+/Na+ antiporter
MLTIYRDLGFFIVSLILYWYILQKGVIYDFEAVILISMTLFYAFAVWYTNKKINEMSL